MCVSVRVCELVILACRRMNSSATIPISPQPRRRRHRRHHHRRHHRRHDHRRHRPPSQSRLASSGCPSRSTTAAQSVLAVTVKLRARARAGVSAGVSVCACLIP